VNSTYLNNTFCAVDGTAGQEVVDCVARGYQGCRNDAYGHCYNDSICIDADHGINVDLASNATNGTSIVLDACINATFVREAYCDGSSVESQAIDCNSSGLGHCEAGACVQECHESDYGDNPVLNGTTQNSTYTGVDRCLDAPGGSGLLTEYYCSGSSVNQSPRGLPCLAL